MGLTAAERPVPGALRAAYWEDASQPSANAIAAIAAAAA
ncbi:hypothetical protein GLE_0371 [Lysobacter enzymogenes]|uniref:Uncharacterized protein n=1 Tax=Lysobacter enzymogenes TaxID=69 RepID=A0A0S2DBB5_LYSEN|nr:hypothetical protein GLE_0371 [Lysobacter enzymogenes]